MGTKTTNATPDFRLSLTRRWSASGSLLCVGIDPDTSRIPEHLGKGPDAILAFCRAIVDATAQFACAFKPQIAYFAAARAETQLEALIAHIHIAHPGIPVILDAKRGDIGATGTQYASEAFDRYDADAVTVNPYMGFDSIEPFLAHTGRGVILLCRTSNPGGDDLQMLQTFDANARPDGASVGAPPRTDSGATALPGACTQRERLFERVARLAANDWNAAGQLGLVVGATYPQELAIVRGIAPDMPLLVPGIGAQGGDIDATVAAGLDAGGAGLAINAGRSILYASRGRDFAEAAARTAADTCTAIDQARRKATGDKNTHLKATP